MSPAQNLSERTTYSEARQALRRPEFFKSQRWYGQKSRSNRVGACEEILIFERKFLAKMQTIGIPMYSHCVMRTRVEQAAIFAAGHSKAKPGFSPHQYGYAVDIVHSVFGWNMPDGDRGKCWQLIGAIGKEVAAAASIDIEWGGDWDFYDPAHWQIKNWRELAGV
jgi:D-alanyl-D-alanine carboxypeptidase